MSKARNLSDFISDATIDSTEIADLSVTHAKLHTDMNLSSKTLTFAANQISGNSVDGGVISNFASTGIDDNASATAVTILSDGKVGIGDSSVTSGFKTEINHSGQTYGIKLTDGSGRNIRFGTGDCEISSTGSNFDIRTTDLRHLIFRTNNVPRMQIHADGHIGFGDNVINDSAWSTVFGARSQWDTKGVVAATDGSMQIGHNWYYDAGGTTGYKYIASGKANRMILVDDYISWETTDTAGTAGGEITMTEKMRLSSDGSLLINRTSNLAASKLLVKGTKGGIGGSNGMLTIVDDQAYNVSDNGGSIAFAGDFYSGGQVVFATISGIKANNTDANNAGELNFYTRQSSGDLRRGMTLNSDRHLSVVGNINSEGYMYANNNIFFSTIFTFNGGGTQTIFTVPGNSSHLVTTRAANYGGTDDRHGKLYLVNRHGSNPPEIVLIAETDSTGGIAISGNDLTYTAGGGNPYTQIYFLRLA